MVCRLTNPPIRIPPLILVEPANPLTSPPPPDMNGAVSESLWIYFVLTIPLTVIVVGIWWYLDRYMKDQDAKDQESSDQLSKKRNPRDHLNDLEGQIMGRLAATTGARVTWNNSSPITPTFSGSRDNWGTDRPINIQ